MRGHNDVRGTLLMQGAIVLTALLLRPLAASAAPILTGDSISATLGTSGTVVTQFTSPATVGDDIEFTGAFRDGGRSAALHNVTIDFSASGFTLGWTGGGVPITIGGLIRITLTGLDFSEGALITGVTRTGWECLPADDSACRFGIPSGNVSFTGNSISLAFDSMKPIETYTYAITAEAPVVTAVPEPASLTLFGTGLAALAVRWRRRGANRTDGPR
jgi:PEP-CTERM motif